MKGIKPPKLILLIDDETSIQELVHACLSDFAAGRFNPFFCPGRVKTSYVRTPGCHSAGYDDARDERHNVYSKFLEKPCGQNDPHHFFGRTSRLLHAPKTATAWRARRDRQTI